MKLIDTLRNLGERSKHAERMLSEPNYDVIQIQMKRNEELTTHHAEEETLIIVRTGKVEFILEEQLVVLTNEQIFQMAPMEKHSLKALEATDLILIKFK